MNPLTEIRDLVYQKRFTEAFRLTYSSPYKVLALSYLHTHTKTSPKLLRTTSFYLYFDSLFSVVLSYEYGNGWYYYVDDHSINLFYYRWGYGWEYGNGGCGDGFTEYEQSSTNITRLLRLTKSC